MYQSPTCNLLLSGKCSPGPHLLLLQGLLLRTQALHIADIWEWVLPPVKVGRESVFLYLGDTWKEQHRGTNFIFKTSPSQYCNVGITLSDLALNFIGLALVQQMSLFFVQSVSFDQQSKYLSVPASCAVCKVLR